MEAGAEVERIRPVPCRVARRLAVIGCQLIVDASEDAVLRGLRRVGERLPR